MAVKTPPNLQGSRLLPLRAVIEMTGRCKTSIYLAMRAGTFPQMVKVGGSSRWLESELLEWVAQRAAERDKLAA